MNRDNDDSRPTVAVVAVHGVADQEPATSARAVAERVHVYEVHWADLSRASTGALRLLGELYQLILHLPNLGRQALDMAELAHPGRWSWRWYARLHRWAVRVFTLLLPVLVVLSAAVLLVPLPGGVIPGDGTWGRGGAWDLAKGGLAVAVLALLMAVGTGYLTRRLATRRRTVPVFLVAPWAGRCSSSRRRSAPCSRRTSSWRRRGAASPWRSSPSSSPPTTGCAPASCGPPSSSPCPPSPSSCSSPSPPASVTARRWWTSNCGSSRCCWSSPCWCRWRSTCWPSRRR